MWTKLLIVVACLYAVHASVAPFVPEYKELEKDLDAPVDGVVGIKVTSEVLEEAGIEADPQARSCNIFTCANICAALGFRFAQCRGGICYCWR